MSVTVTKDLTKCNRREMLSVACAAALIAGCKSQDDPAEKPAAAKRSSVPLRVLWVGKQAEIDVVTRAWGSVMEQPLKVELIEFDRSKPTGLNEQITAVAKKHDLIVYPICAAADLGFADLLLPLGQKDIDTSEENLGKVYTAVRNGAAKFGRDYTATSIGAQLPALLSVDEVENEIETWAEYHDWVKNELSGAASEPLSNGWAGASFLWRAASSVKQSWLFGRERLEPLVDGDEFVATLDQMLQTTKQYKNEVRSPQEIWSGLQVGDLRGAIGFQVFSEESSADINVSDCPGDSGKVMLDPFARVVSISAGCRQSAASKQWMNWLSGGEGTESVRRQIDSMTITRSEAEFEGVESQQQIGSNYQRWLRERLNSSVHLASLRLLKADQYYSILDQEITNCVNGKSKPKEALQAVAANWQTLNKEVSLEKQQRAWRRAKGMSG